MSETSKTQYIICPKELSEKVQLILFGCGLKWRSGQVTPLYLQENRDEVFVIDNCGNNDFGRQDAASNRVGITLDLTTYP